MGAGPHIFQCNIFQHNIFQNTCGGSVTTSSPGGGNLEYLRRGFIRKRRKLEEAIAAARKAELKADKRGELELEIAAHEAAQVLSAFHEQAELSDKELSAFTRILRSAQGAKTVEAALKSANAIDQYVVSYKAHLREQDDEEEAITLLLLS